MRWLLLACICVASEASAHDADVIYAFVVQEDGHPELLTEHLTMTDATLRLLAPVDVDGDGAVSQAELDAKAAAIRAGVWDDAPLTGNDKPCSTSWTTADLRSGFVELRAHFLCSGGELRQDFRFLRVLPANYRVVLGSQSEGERAARGVAQGSLSAIRIPPPPSKLDWRPDAFLRGLDGGLSRGFALEALALVACLMFSLGSWRRGLQGAGLVLLGLFVAAWVELFPSAAVVLALAGAFIAALRPSPALGLLVGCGIGAQGGGEGWAKSLGVFSGSALVLVPAALALLAVGVIVARRPGLEPARWVLFGVALVAAALVRLS